MPMLTMSPELKQMGVLLHLLVWLMLLAFMGGQSLSHGLLQSLVILTNPSCFHS